MPKRMYKLKYHIANEKFGKLTAIKPIEGRHHGVMWLCQCDCGKETLVSSSNLRYKQVQSCGCIKGEKRKLIDSPERHIYYTYKKSALRRNYTFNIEFDDFKLLMNKPCEYCGLLDSNSLIYRRKKETKIITFNGLDRVDNTIGYELHNVVSCCRHCNVAKNTMTLPDFRVWINRIYNKVIRGINVGT